VTADVITQRLVAVVEEAREFAELPSALGVDVWSAALAYEMAHGVWRGLHVRLASARDADYHLFVGAGPLRPLWRDRTAELAARAHDLAETLAVAGDVAVPRTTTGPTDEEIDRALDAARRGVALVDALDALAEAPLPALRRAMR